VLNTKQNEACLSTAGLINRGAVLGYTYEHD